MPQFELKCDAGHTGVAVQSFRYAVPPKHVFHRTAQSVISRWEGGKPAMVFINCPTCGGHEQRIDVPAFYLPPAGTPTF